MSRALKHADKAQLEASDPTASVFVTANAGSGKTKVLVDRIARLLLDGSKPSAFLCITYTKAAAAEMQSRLFDRLGRWCITDDATLAAELAKLGANPNDLGRARALFAQALETPGGLKIQTIHAFCERLLARFPLEAGVPPGFDIADEARAGMLLGQARADAALADEAPAHAFRRFAARLGGDQLDRLFDRLALRRADFHRYVARQGLYPEATIQNRHGVRESADSLCGAFIARQDWNGLARAALALARGSKQDNDAAERLRTALDCIAAPRKALAACFAFCFTGDGDARASLATAKTKAEHPWLEPALQRFADACLELRDKLNAAERAEDAIAALQLATMLDKAYERAKARAGALDFDDLIEHARRLLNRADLAPWVLYKLDGGLDHILIDEGQDTSPRQWDLIQPLQDEFFAGRGARTRVRTVFAVGDPKQSIFAFQGADPRRFIGECRALAKRAQRAKLKFNAPDLKTSFRSAPEVLRAVDAVFADRELIEVGAGKRDPVEHLAARDKQVGTVEVWPVAMRLAAPPSLPWDAPVDVETGVSVHAQLAKAIARRVETMIETRQAVWDKDTRQPRAVVAGDVLALVRTRGALFRELIKAFKRRNLPVAGADRMVLRDELAVEDCLALMRVALDPFDDLALACVLKGPWCGLDDDDADLFPLAYSRARNQTLHQRLMETGEAKYAPAQAFVSELMARAGADPFAFLSWALETPHNGGPSGWARVFTRLGAETRDPLEELLQRALKPSPHTAATLQRFLYEVELDAEQVKRELEAETGAIRVMTVHGAKGLEAPVVILPDTTGPASDKPDDNLIFDDDEGPFVAFKKIEDDVKTEAARAKHEARMLSEHWRLLYVAMTRARDHLLVCGAQHGAGKSGETPVAWRAAVESALKGLPAAACETPFGEGLRLGAPAVGEHRAHARAAPAALPAWALTPARSPIEVEATAPSHAAHTALISPRGDGQKRFRRGRLIHGLLERLPDIAPARREDAARVWLARQGADGAEGEDFAREALRVISDPRFAIVFAASSRAEQPIVGVAAGRPVRGIVDRLAVDDEHVIVLDYKTDRPAPSAPEKAPEAYVLQMALYREVMRQIFPDKSVSCALLWTEAPVFMELPAARLDAALASFA